MSHWTQLEADRAFTSARRAALAARVRRFGRAVCGLSVYDEATARRPAERGLREIPLERIAGTTEPNRAAQFDVQFRPAAQTRCRWQRVWMAIQGGITLPPISVVRVGDGYAIRDGHHRVSVAKALGAPTINAIVA
jgi:ParB-like nuclease domain